MRARIVGGALAWAVSLAPLVVVNLIAYLGVFTLDEAAVIGAVALVAGVALGALTAGLVGGRARDLSADATEESGRAATPTQRLPSMRGAPGGMMAPRLGAQGALATGGIAATLYALTMGGLLLLAGSFNILPNIVTLHPIRITAAILCVAAVFLGLAMLVGWLATRGATGGDMGTAPATVGSRMGAPGVPPVGQPVGVSAMRAPVAATRPLTPTTPVRGANARATRPLTAAEYGAPGTYNGQDGYRGQGAYAAYAHPSQAASRPREQRDPRYPTPTGQPSESYAQHDPYVQRDPRDPAGPLDDTRRRDGYTDDGAYRQRRSANDSYGDEYDGQDEDEYPGGYGGYGGHKRPRHNREPVDRRYRRHGAEADVGYDDDDEVDEIDADDGRRGDGHQRDTRAGGRRPARGDDRYER